MITASALSAKQFSKSGQAQFQEGGNTMAFVNAKVTDQDLAEITPMLDYEKIKAIARWIPKYSMPYRWSVDRERKAFLISLVGGNRDQFPYYVLGLQKQIVIFNVEDKGNGSDADGIHEHKIVHDIKIPEQLKSHKEEIKQLIRDGLEEEAFFRPLNDGGTFANPNTVARGNILSFNVEFK